MGDGGCQRTPPVLKGLKYLLCTCSFIDFPKLLTVCIDKEPIHVVDTWDALDTTYYTQHYFKRTKMIHTLNLLYGCTFLLGREDESSQLVSQRKFPVALWFWHNLSWAREKFMKTNSLEPVLHCVPCSNHHQLADYKNRSWHLVFSRGQVGGCRPTFWGCKYFILSVFVGIFHDEFFTMLEWI